MSERGTPHASYTAGFKLRVVSYAVDHGNRAAGNKFSVDESCVRRWRVQREKLTYTPKMKRANHHGVAHFPELETELACWVREKRQGGFGVSTNVICLKAKLIAKKSGSEEEKKFRASKHWCYRFMERNGFSIRCRTTVAQKLPKDYKNKLINFQRFVISKRKQHNFELKHIGNADQTPLTL